jgi:hypothetical protein
MAHLYAAVPRNSRLPACGPLCVTSGRPAGILSAATSLIVSYFTGLFRGKVTRLGYACILQLRPSPRRTARRYAYCSWSVSHHEDKVQRHPTRSVATLPPVPPAPHLRFPCISPMSSSSCTR